MRKRPRHIYLDYAATTPAHPEVVKAMQPYFSRHFGNPSSIYSLGQEARQAIEEAREGIAGFMGAKKEEIVFTSSGTEANNFALKGIAWANEKKGNHIITSSIEHHAIIEPLRFLQGQGFKVSYLRVDKDGLVDPEDVQKAITPKTILISIMHANNEIGVIQPIAQIGRIARGKEIYFHTDAVQTFGHIPLNVDQLNVDLLSVSGHKLYGPKGVGALYIRRGTKIASFLQGGEQERNRRASTENVPGIIGLAKAVEIAQKELDGQARRLTGLRDKLIKAILENIEDAQLNGHAQKRLPNNVNITIKYVEGEAMLLNLDLAGIAASTGSACSSSNLRPSHVLLALGLSPEIAHGSLRFSLGRDTTEKDIDYVSQTLPRIVARLRALSPLKKERESRDEIPLNPPFAKGEEREIRTKASADPGGGNA